MKIAIITNIGRITEAGQTKHIYIGRCENGKFYAITRNTAIVGQVTPDFTFLPKSAVKSAVMNGTAVMFHQEGTERIEEMAEDATQPMNAFRLAGARFKSGTVRNGMMLPQLVNATQPQPFGSIYADGINKGDYKPLSETVTVPSGGTTNNIQPANGGSYVVWIPYYN